MARLSVILDAGYHFIRFLFREFSPMARLLYGHYFREKFAVKIEYAEQPVILRGGTSDIKVFYEVFALELYKLPEKEVATILDIGANAGYASLYFAHFYPNARIIAVEPEGSNYQALLENTRSYKNITCLQAAIWSQETDLALQNPGDSKWSFQYAKDTGKGPAIRSQTLPGLMEKFDLQRIDLLKMDIEGGEEAVFASNTDWMRLVDCLLIELHSEKARKTVFDVLARYPHSSSDAFDHYHFFLDHGQGR
jgi:FkbM family methyltransferase